MIQNFFQKVLGRQDKELQSPEAMIMKNNYMMIRIASLLVIGISIYWLVIDQFSADYNLTTIAKIGVIAQLISSVWMFFIPNLAKRTSTMFIRVNFIIYYIIIIAGVGILTLMRNLSIIEAGEVSSNIGVSVSAFYLFMIAFVPVPAFVDSVIVVACMTVGLVFPDVFMKTSTYSLFSHIVLAGCFILTYHFYRKILFENAKHQIEIARLNTVMLEHSYVDSLTGILNRRSLDVYLDYVKAHSTHKEIGVAFFDTDYFKKFNDHYGHVAGDEALKKIAQSILSWFRDLPDAYIFRYGGEEFVVIVGGATEEELTDIMIQIRDMVYYDAKVLRGDVEGFDRLTITIGGAIEKVTNEARDYIRNADNQMYLGKRSYRNCVYLNGKCVDAKFQIDSELVRRNFEGQLYSERFEEALSNREFLVYLQPQYDTKTSEIIAAEALVRWRTGEGKMVSPGEFIPLFEITGQIGKVDEFVLSEVANLLRVRSEAGLKNVPISVNMSRTTLFQAGMIERYAEIMDDYHIAKARIPIEITESATVELSKMESYVKAMKESGFSLHLDDFGTGYSSLGTMGQLPFDLVKLDKGLIDKIGHANGNELIRHTIEMAHFLNVKVIAEGVEKAEQVEFLKSISCDSIQGYYYCRPLPVDEFLKLLDE